MNKDPLLETFAAWTRQEGASQNVRVTPGLIRLKAGWAREEERRKRRKLTERIALAGAGLGALLLGLTLPVQHLALLGAGALLPCLAVANLLGFTFAWLLES